MKTLPYLNIANLEAFKVVKIDVSEIEYGRIIKQKDGDRKILVIYFKNMEPR